MSYPECPQLTVRLGVAGQRSLGPVHFPSVSAQLQELYAAIDECLLAIGKSQAATHSAGTRLYDSGRAPKLRLVSGLADGADQLAARLFLQDSAAHPERELAAVLPFDAATYRDHSPILSRDAFDALLAKCVYVLELDGVWRAKDSGDSARDALAATARDRAYRQQAQILVRHCDLMVLVGNYQGTVRPGGTLETARHALELGLPIVWIEAGGAEPALLRSLGEWIDFDPTRRASSMPWQEDLGRCIRDMTTNPLHARHLGDYGPAPAAVAATAARDSYRDQLLGVYSSRQPPSRSGRQALWEGFERWMAPRVQRTQARLVIDHGPVADFRLRAAELSRHFVGKYRGAFLLNYGLAALAVTAATTSLATIVLGGELRSTILDFLLALVLIKLVIVVGIYFNTRIANQQAWSEVATDFRYLTERLRPLAFLTPLGALRSPPPGTELYATRIERQSAVDWLADAIVRGLQPLRALRAPKDHRIVQIDTAATLEARCVRWIDEQIGYHSANVERMRRMNERLERFSARLIKLVVAVVGADLLLIAAHRLHALPELLGLVSAYKPILIGLSAVIPAFVASMNGIRFQSECQRIADRSAFMHRVLAERRRAMVALIGTIGADRARRGSELGSWTLAAVLQAESLAQVTVEEAAEWSVLYAKHMFES